MINLLPDNYKKEIMAGRSNLLLVRYCIFSLIVTVAIVSIMVVVALMIDDIKSTSQQIIDDNEASSHQLATQQAEVSEFQQNLQTAKNIFDKQIDYSAVALRMANTIPRGVVVDNILLDPATFDQPTTLTARARSEAAALSLKQSFTDSPYYSDVFFNNISNDSTSGDSNYPFTINLGLTINKSILHE